jgi:hypothetical protein
MAGYPQLFPAGFIEFKDPCSGPTLYRDQPSRSSYGCTLNDMMNKYVTAEYTDSDFIRMLTYLKHFNRTWDKLTDSTKEEILESLLKSSTSGMASELRSRLFRDEQQDAIIENFGDTTEAAAAAAGGNETHLAEQINKLFKKLEDKYPLYKNVKCVPANNRISLLVIIVVAIVCIVLGFLIAYAK